MNTLLRWLLALAIGMAASFSDFDCEGADCRELFTIEYAEIDQDGNAYWAIYVTPFMQENGTDSLCEQFGRCIFDLIASADQMAAVEIVNPANEWVPSIRRWITADWAMALAGIADLEEQAMMSQYAYHPSERIDP